MKRRREKLLRCKGGHITAYFDERWTKCPHPGCGLTELVDVKN